MEIKPITLIEAKMLKTAGAEQNADVSIRIIDNFPVIRIRKHTFYTYRAACQFLEFDRQFLAPSQEVRP